AGRADGADRAARRLLSFRAAGDDSPRDHLDRPASIADVLADDRGSGSDLRVSRSRLVPAAADAAGVKTSGSERDVRVRWRASEIPSYHFVTKLLRNFQHESDKNN